MKTDKAPTLTSKVQKLLEEADDFLTAQAICAATGLTLHQCAMTLTHLKMHRVVDCCDNAGTLYWFANYDDNRVKVVNERKPEDGPRMRRRGRKTNDPHKRSSAA